MYYLVGEVNVWGVIDNYFTKDNKNFFFDDKGQKPLNKEDLENWALVLNSPWSGNNLKYETKMNPNYEIDGEDKTWKTTYSIVGYDSIRAEVIGYGKDEKESLENCINLFKYLQETYNKDDECF